MALLKIKNISKTYPTGVKAVDNISMEMDVGVYSLMGPNGSGKTTTLTMVGGALKPDKGEILVKGYSVWGDGYIEARRHMGLALQDMPFYNNLTGMDNLIYVGLLKGLSLWSSRAKAKELLELVGLWEHRNLQVSRYSGGMRRRLAIAAALIHDPEILLLDEPGSGLDPKAREELWSLLLSLKEGRLILFSSHDGEEVRRFAEYVYIFHRGRIIEEGRPDELIGKYVPDKQLVVWIEEGKPPIINGVEPVVIGMSARYLLRDIDIEDVINGLRREGVSFSRIEIVEPSLSEVFMVLTGERLS